MPALDSPSELFAANRQRPMPEDLARVAIVRHAGAGSAGAGVPAIDAFAAAIGMLAAQTPVHFDYFPTEFSGAGAAGSIRQSFERIEQLHAFRHYDAILVVGGADLETDIGVVHQVLAPCIERAPAPVLCALGPDDAETILGDTACRVYPDPQALLAAVTQIIERRHPPAEALLERVRSLAGFLVNEQQAETRILLQASVLPAVERHLQQQLAQTTQVGARLRDVRHLLTLRLARDEAALEQARALIAVQLARLAQARESEVRVGATQWQLGLGITFGYACLLAFLWWWTTPANLVFFGGCALVVISAVYVALSNRIADRAVSRPLLQPAAELRHIEPILGDPGPGAFGLTRDALTPADQFQGTDDERFTR